MPSIVQLAPRRRLALTPLIDVVFLLLMFFMLTSSFDKFTTVELTVGGKSSSATATAAKITNIIVRIHDKGRVDVNGDPVEMKLLPIAVLTAIKAQKLEFENVRILLQPRAKSQSQAVVDAVSLLKRAKLHNIVIVR